MDELVYTVDIGTQSIRGMFVNSSGEIVDMEQEIYTTPYLSRHSQWAEQSPSFYYDALCRVSRILSERSGNLFKRTIAMTITTMRDTVLCLDNNNNPLRDIIIWLDKRETNADKLPKIPLYKKFLFSLVGMQDVVKTQQQQSSCNWIMTNQKEIWQKTSKYVLISTYINYLLTGILKDSKANMAAHMPFDTKKGCWQKRGLTRFIYDIPINMLCDVCDSGEEIGKITSKTSKESGIPEGLSLIASGTDKSCETLGLSVNSPEKAALSLGTAATVQFVSSKYFEAQAFAPSYMSVVKGKWNIETQIYRGYWMISWFKEQFAFADEMEAKIRDCRTEDILNEHLKEIPPGCNGLVLQPYWGPGVCTPNARGSIIGFTDTHTRYHIYRAIIEGIGFALYDAMLTMEKRGKLHIKELFIGGGGSRSNAICQIIADIFGRPVNRVQTNETCGIGASIVAFVSKGIFSSYEQAISNMVHIRDTFTPDITIHKYYNTLYNKVYRKIYKKVLPLCKTLKIYSGN